MCKNCPWKSPETCGACKRDGERRKLDNDRDNNKKLQKSLQKQSKEIRKTKAKNIIGKSLMQEEKIAEVKPVEIKSVELTVDIVKPLIDKGKNYKEIAKMLNVEYNKLYYFINKNNLNPSKPKKKSKERKKTKNKEDIGDIP